MIEYYKKTDFKVSKWSGGETTELLLLPKNASYKERNFSVRLSSATLDIPVSSFTYLGEIKRFITPITRPFLLEVNRSEPFLLSPFEVFEFSGTDEVKSYGMSVDFNLMLNEKYASAWMKTLNKSAQKKLELSLKHEDVFWIFSYFENKIMLDDAVYSMDAYSLLVLKNLEKELIFSANENLIYGCVKII